MEDKFNEIYKIIAEILSQVAPEGWQVVSVNSLVEESSGESYFDFLDAQGDNFWFEPQVHAQYDIYSKFKELRCLMIADGYPAWIKATFKLSREGRFNIHFDYE